MKQEPAQPRIWAGGEAVGRGSTGAPQGWTEVRWGGAGLWPGRGAAGGGLGAGWQTQRVVVVPPPPPGTPPPPPGAAAGESPFS